MMFTLDPEERAQVDAVIDQVACSCNSRAPVRTKIVELAVLHGHDLLGRDFTYDPKNGEVRYEP